MTATCVQAEETQLEEEDTNIDKRMSRRDATLLIESVPVERMYQKPKVIYKKLSKSRYKPPKGKYNPIQPRHTPHRPNRTHRTKYKSKVNSKYGPTGYEKRDPKLRYAPLKRPTSKPVYGTGKKPPRHPHPHYRKENAGFAEPPTRFVTKNQPPKNKFAQDFMRPVDYDYPSKPFENDFSSKPNSDKDILAPTSYSYNFGSKPFDNDLPSKHFDNDYGPKPFGNDIRPKPFNNDFPPKPSYNNYRSNQQSQGEPPVDSYGAPIKQNLHDLTHPSTQSFVESSIDHGYNYGLDAEIWKSFNDKKQDNGYASTKNVLKYSKPDIDVFVTPVPEEPNEELGLNSYSDIYTYRQTKEKNKKKPSYYDNVKVLNKPWKGKMKDNFDEEIIVGGQYAEPPERYVPKFLRDGSSHDDFAPTHFSSDSEISSATISSYVNYKNSNMAFSPQNLNDAFSIVDN